MHNQNYNEEPKPEPCYSDKASSFGLSDQITLIQFDALSDEDYESSSISGGQESPQSLSCGRDLSEKLSHNSWMEINKKGNLPSNEISYYPQLKANPKVS